MIRTTHDLSVFLKVMPLFRDVEFVFSVFKPVKHCVFNPFPFGLSRGPFYVHDWKVREQMWEMCQNPVAGESESGSEML